MSMSCSTWMMAWTARSGAPRHQDLHDGRACRAVLTPLVGSSRRMISGRSAKAAATSRSFLSPWGRARAGTCALVGEAEELGHLERAVLDLGGRAARDGQEAAARAETRGHRGLERLEHRELGEDLDELEAPGHAQPRRARTGPMPAMSRPLKRTVPALGREQAGQHVDQCGLAGAVRPDDGDELALRRWPGSRRRARTTSP